MRRSLDSGPGGARSPPDPVEEARLTTTTTSRPPAVGDPPLPRPARGRRLAAELGVVVVYLLASGLLHHRVLGDLAGRATGWVSSDSSLFTWWLGWTWYAPVHGLDPLTSTAQNAPDGVNGMWNTGVPLLGVLLAPVTATAGPVVADNLAMILGPAVSGVRRAPGAHGPRRAAVDPGAGRARVRLLPVRDRPRVGGPREPGVVGAPAGRAVGVGAGAGGTRSRRRVGAALAGRCAARAGLRGAGRALHADGRARGGRARRRRAGAGRGGAPGGVAAPARPGPVARGGGRGGRRALRLAGVGAAARAEPPAGPDPRRGDDGRRRRQPRRALPAHRDPAGHRRARRPACAPTRASRAPTWAWRCSRCSSPPWWWCARGPW